MTLPKHSLILSLILLCLTACSTANSPPYQEADLPAAVPAQFQGWWKGKSEWDYLHLAPDGMMQTVFPKDLQAPFNPALTTPGSGSFMKVFRNQGDTLYGITKEQLFNRKTGAWMLPIYYYVTLHYDFRTHILTYVQQPCGLTEDDFEKDKNFHLQKLATSACTITEESAGQHLWKRMTTYYRT